MTGVAGEPSRVIRRGNLGKALRFGAVGLMTTGTQDGCVQLFGLHRTGIVRVHRLRPVASLTGDHYMFAKSFLIHDVGMASLAGVVPSKRDRPRRDLADRRASIVAILPKTERYDRSPQDHERHHRYCDDYCQPNEVFDVLEQVRVPATMPRSAAKNCAMYVDSLDSSRER